VWLDPRPAGLLIHEALGHRLEGNRMLSKGEGQTFRDALETGMLPPALRVYDDPSLTHVGGESLIGHYRYDDEGVAASRADMIDEGRVGGFLTTRMPIGPRHRSNGHARCETFERPVSRMAVTMVEAADPVPEAEMRRLLLQEVKRRNLPFGVRILDAEGGETATKAYDFQAFLGEIKVATRIFPDGREELIRGANFVGTPLNAVGGIVAAGTRAEVDNSYCGAESGYVPVSTVSPAVVVEDLELQSDARRALGAYTYPLPWA
jgi:predicted Zn-dependent protease